MKSTTQTLDFYLLFDAIGLLARFGSPRTFKDLLET